MCFLRFYRFFYYFLTYVLQNRSYPDVEFYGWKNKRENMFLTDKIARKSFCVGGLFYPLIFVWVFSQLAKKYDKKLKIKIKKNCLNKINTKKTFEYCSWIRFFLVFTYSLVGRADADLRFIIFLLSSSADARTSAKVFFLDFRNFFWKFQSIFRKKY